MPINLEGLPDLPEPPEELREALKRRREQAKGIQIGRLRLVRATWSDALVGLLVVAFFSVLIGWLMYLAFIELGLGSAWAVTLALLIAPVVSFFGCGLRLKRRYRE